MSRKELVDCLKSEASLEVKSRAMETLKLWKVIERRCQVLAYITDPENLVRERYTPK